MKAKLQHFNIKNSLEKTGDDITSFELYIETEAHNEIHLPISVYPKLRIRDFKRIIHLIIP